MKDKKGQNLIEYILLVVAVVIVCIFFLTNGPMKQSINASLESMVGEINSINNQIVINNQN